MPTPEHTDAETDDLADELDPEDFPSTLIFDAATWCITVFLAGGEDARIGGSGSGRGFSTFLIRHCKSSFFFLALSAETSFFFLFFGFLTPVSCSMCCEQETI